MPHEIQKGGEGRRPDLRRILQSKIPNERLPKLAVARPLVSLLDEKGSPGIVERAVEAIPPSSQIGPIAESQRAEIRKSLASIYGHYDQTIDRESAYEKVKARTLAKETPAGPGAAPAGPAAQPTGFRDVRFEHPVRNDRAPRGGRHEGLVDAAAKSAARSFGSAVSRSIIRGALGSILGSGSRGRR